MNNERDFLNSRIRTTNFSTIVSMSLVLFLLAIILYTWVNADALTNKIKEQVAFSFIIKNDVERTAIENLQIELQTQPFVKKINIISPEEASESLKKDLGEDFEEVIGFNPLSYTVDISLQADYVNNTSIDAIKKQYASNSIIKEIQYQPSFIEKVNSNLVKVMLILSLFFIIFFMISIILINDNIKLSTYSKRFLIKSMQLVGATENFICMPFVWNGLLNGIIATFIATSLFFASLYLIELELDNIKNLYSENVVFIIIGIITLFGLTMASISNYFAVKKFLNTKTSHLY